MNKYTETNKQVNKQKKTKKKKKKKKKKNIIIKKKKQINIKTNNCYLPSK